MFDIFSTNKIEKQICKLHVAKLEVVQVHNEIRKTVNDFRVSCWLPRLSEKYAEMLKQEKRKSDQEYNDIIKRIQSTIKYLKNHVTRL